MSAYPVTLEGTALRALVVGGGTVAARKIRALLDAGARVRVVAPEFDRAAEIPSDRMAVERREYRADDIGDAMVVIAATSSRNVNAQVARDALKRGRLVNVVDAPEEGNFTTPAVHRTGDLVVAVTAGGVPAAAARIRDAIAERFSERYRDAVAELSALRAALLRNDSRERWTALSGEVIGPDFCEAVERGALTERLAPWR